jgi:hypothetical protein
MSVFFEGNAFIDEGQVQNALLTNNTISNSAIITSSLDMNLENITNVKDPINPQDAATKKYVDDLGVVISNITLSGTTGTLISSNQSGSYNITVRNNVINGPTATFHVTKNSSSLNAQCNRISASPGYSTTITLFVTWPPNNGIFLNKNGSLFDGSYQIKLI